MEQIALFALEEAVKEAPALWSLLQSHFSKPAPTAQDWADLRKKVKAKSYADYVPASALPPIAL